MHKTDMYNQSIVQNKLYCCTVNEVAKQFWLPSKDGLKSPKTREQVYVKLLSRLV